jgi:hypothetical protein
VKQERADAEDEERGGHEIPAGPEKAAASGPVHGPEGKVDCDLNVRYIQRIVSDVGTYRR